MQGDELNIRIWGVDDDTGDLFGAFTRNDWLGEIDVTFSREDNYGEGYHLFDSDAGDYSVEFYIWRCYDDFCRDPPPGKYDELYP